MLLPLAGLSVALAWDVSNCLGKPEIYDERLEMHNTLNVEGTNENYGCIGGSKNDYSWNSHRTAGDDTMMFLETLQIWTGGHWGGVKKICMGYGTGDVQCEGSASGNAQCSWTFLNTDRIHSLVLYRNSEGVVKGDLRFGGIEINMERSGQIQNFKCGKDHNRKYVANDIAGKQLAGFFGSVRKSQICQIGVMSFTPKCTIISQEIIGVECKGATNDRGACVANFAEYGDDLNVAFMYSKCDACHTSGGGGAECMFSFSRSTTNEITHSSTSIDSIDTGAESTISAGVGIEIEGIFNAGIETSQSFYISYGHTWEESKSMTTSTTVTIANECHYKAPAGTGVMAEGSTTIGSLMADLVYTIQTTTSCDSEDGEPNIEKYNGEVLVEDVALTTMMSSCKYYDIECDANIRCPDLADCNTCTFDEDCKWTEGGCLAGTDDSYPSMGECQGQCPETNPFAYRPDYNFDHCCATGADKEGNENINSGPKPDRANSCKNDAFVKCSNPPCEDFAGYCPSTHPWAYRPDDNFDYCCGSAADCNGNAEINAGPRPDRAQCCKDDNFMKCDFPPCQDYATSRSRGQMQEVCEVAPRKNIKCDKKCCKLRHKEMNCKWDGEFCREKVPEICTMDDTAWTGKSYKAKAASAVECYLKCASNDGMPEGKTCRAYTYAPYARKQCRMYIKNKITKDSEGKMSGKRNCHPVHGKMKRHD